MLLSPPQHCVRTSIRCVLLVLVVGCDEDDQFLGSKHKARPDGAAQSTSGPALGTDGGLDVDASTAGERGAPSTSWRDASRVGSDAEPADAGDHRTRLHSSGEPQVHTPGQVTVEAGSATPPPSPLRDAGSSSAALVPVDPAMSRSDGGADSGGHLLPVVPPEANSEGIALPTNWEEFSQRIADDCSVTGYSVSSTLCQLQADCAGQSSSVTCSPSGAGQNGCTCSNAAGFSQYTVRGAELLGACALMVDHCFGSLGWEGEAAECSSETSYDTEGCSLQTTCSHPVQLAGGAHAYLDEHSVPRASCTTYQGAHLLCGCSAAQRSESLIVTGAQFDTACSLAVDTCLEQGEAVFEDDGVCVEGELHVYSDGCNIDAQCGPVAQIRDGVRVRRANTYSLGCGSASDGLWHCSCLGRNDATLGLELPQSDPSPCETLESACYPPQTLTRDGEWTCDTSSTRFEGELCHAIVPCDSRGTVGAETVQLRAQAELVCQQAGEGPFSCSCAGTLATNSVLFEQALAADAGETCDLAIAQCAELARTGATELSAL